MRLLGKTNMKVNRVGFGGIPIQRITQEETNKVINELIDKNVNFIDTARAYTISEEYIGNAIEGKREKFFIATKSMARDYESMKQDIEISLKNLKTDYIDLYQNHNLKPEEYKTIFDENKAYKALLEAKEEGEKFSTIQFPYNIIEDQADEVFKKANKKDIGIIVMKPLAGGAIDDAKLAIKYILSKDYIDVVIPGMESIEQVRENVSVLQDTNITKDDELKIQEIRNIMGKRFCRRCEYCLPCPLKINIPQNFLLEGYYARYNLKDWAKERYKSLEVKASACVECGLCETKCPYELPIREMLKEVSSKLG